MGKCSRQKKARRGQPRPPRFTDPLARQAADAPELNACVRCGSACGPGQQECSYCHKGWNVPPPEQPPVRPKLEVA